jgi:hypothetical protein
MSDYLVKKEQKQKVKGHGTEKNHNCQALSMASSDEGLKTAAKSFLAGWVGGVGNLLVGHPFDTVKTRLQDDIARK